MSVDTWLFHLLLSSVGLAISALLAAAVLWAWRRHPIASYRLGVLVVAVSLALPLAQVAIEMGEVSTERLARRAWAPIEVAEPALVSDMLPSPATAEPPELPFLGVLLAASQSLREEEAAGAEAGLVDRAAPVLLAIYLAGFLVALARCSRRLWRTRSILRGATPVSDPAVLSAWSEVAADSPLRGRTRLVASDELLVPACFGLFAPTVVLPVEEPGTTCPEVLRGVLLHELLHLERRDTWVLLLQEVFRILFWFHPATGWLLRRLEVLREVSCDLLVVQRWGGRRRYASALVEYATVLGERSGAVGPRDPVILAWSNSKPQLKKRIEMLLSKGTKRRASWIPAAAGVFACLWCCQLAMAGTPAVDVDTNVVPAPSVSVTTVGDVALGLRVDEVGVALAAQIDRPEDAMLLVEEALAGSPAARAGLRRFDVLIAVDGGGPVTMEVLRDARVRFNDGRAVELTVVRGGKEISLTIDGRPRESGGRARSSNPPQTREAFDKALDFYRQLEANTGNADYHDLYEAGRDYYRQVDRESFGRDMQQAVEQYEEAFSQRDIPGAERYVELMRDVQANPDRYIDAGRQFFRQNSAEDLRRAIEENVQRSRARGDDPSRSDLEHQLREAQRRIEEQQREIAELRAAVEDLRRSMRGAR